MSQSARQSRAVGFPWDELYDRMKDLHRRGWPEPVGFDVESFGPDFVHRKQSKPNFSLHRLAGYSLGFLDGSKYYVPLRAPELQRWDQPAPVWDVDDLSLYYLPVPEYWQLLKFLTLEAPIVYAHNAKTELAVLRNEGIHIKCQLRDSELLAWQAGWKLPKPHGLKLKPLYARYCGNGSAIGDSYKDIAHGRQANAIPLAELEPYAIKDGLMALELGEKAYKAVGLLDGLEHAALEHACIKVTEHMERTGVGLNSEYLLQAAEQCETEMAAVEAEFRALTTTEVLLPTKVKQHKACEACTVTPLGEEHPTAGGRKLCKAGMLYHKKGTPVMETVKLPRPQVVGARIGSDADVSRWLFDELKWWHPTADHPRVAYGYSVKEEYIRKYATLPGTPGHACRLRLRYQALGKYATTYTRSLVDLASQSYDGRLHTSYKQDGTDTARYSSSMPNQSNLPRSTRQALPWTEGLPDVRKAFLPRPGWKVVIFDFSQIELRLMAHYSRDPNLMACYVGENRIDLHERTRSKMGENAQRNSAKITNFSTIYDISPTALARKLAMGTNDFVSYTPQVARGYIDAFYEAYPKVLKYHDRAVAYAQDHLYATSLTGFKRPIKGWTEKRWDPKRERSYSMYGSCKRKAINTPIQASAGGILKRSLVALYDRWVANDMLGNVVNIMGQTYDEIIVECDPKWEARVSADMKELMEASAPELRLPLEVEGGSGLNWSEAK